MNTKVKPLCFLFAYRYDALPCAFYVELGQVLHESGFLACHPKHDVCLGTDVVDVD